MSTNVHPVSMNRVVDGASEVRPVSAIGSQTATVMAAPVDQPDLVEVEYKTSATGWKLVTFKAMTAIAAAEAVIVGYATDASDVTVEANLALALVAAATGTGDEYPNQVYMTAGIPYAQIAWDGTTTIKRFAVITTEAAAHLVAVEMIA